MGENAEGRSSRRCFLEGSAAAITAAAAGGFPGLAFAEERWTAWGWPQPYTQVAGKSVDWLKQQGWWPLKVAWNPLWSDGNVVLFVMQQYDLLGKRGIKAEFPTFLTAGLMNEAYIPGNIQIAQAGALGVLRLIDLRIPTAAVAVYPAQRQAFLVPPDSPLRIGMSDLKGQKVLKRPAICGVTIGSTNHLGLLIASKVLGLKEGEDFIIKNIGPSDIVAMPSGIDLTAIWEPNVLQMTEFLRNARILELVDTYEVFSGYSYVRGEIELNAADVVQAYVDAFLEARLITRLKSEEVLAAFAKHPTQQGRDPDLIRRDVTIHALDPKPTINYPFENARGFFIDLEIYQAQVLADADILRRRYTADDFRAILRPKYFADTYDRLGWALPETPAFVPADWTGKAGEPPYPPYGLMQMGHQIFPQPKELVREWQFGGKVYTPA